MKKTKQKDQAVDSKEVMTKKLAQLRSDVEKIAIERMSGKLHDVTIIGKKKREIAQILTFLRMKELQSV